MKIHLRKNRLPACSSPNFEGVDYRPIYTEYEFSKINETLRCKKCTKIFKSKNLMTRYKKIENPDGTWSLYNQTDKIFHLENKSKKEVDELKDFIDKKKKKRKCT
ncbi:hypothetical protein [Salinimicrobium sp. WS361]|uniref:hypothetical protein n=1 Tax=Salinimicrobium sp. WS361 TaxID=3425123 RepID=UPI003D6DEAAF